MFDEYLGAEDKREFLQGKSFDEKVQLYNFLKQDYSSCVEFVEMLSLDEVKQMLETFSNSERIEFIQFVSQDKLRDIYRNASEEEKKSFLNTFEMRQALHLHNLNDYDEVITKSSNDILHSHDVIQKSKEDIVNANMSIEESTAKIVVNNVSLKKMEKIRKKLEKKAGKLSKKSRIGLFKKKNLEKLKVLMEELNQVKGDLNQIYKENSDLQANISNMEEKIKQSKINLENAEETIKRAKQDIKEASLNSKQTRKAISKLNKQQKKIFGRGLFKKNIHMRGHFLTTMKKEDLYKLQSATELEAEQSKVEEEAKEQAPIEREPEEIRSVDVRQEPVQSVELDDESKADVAKKAADFGKALETLIGNSINPFPAVPVQASPNLGSNQVVITLSKEQLAQLATMITANLENMFAKQQQMQMEQAREEGRVDENGKIIDFEQGRQRIRAKSGRSAAFVSVSILAVGALVLFVVIYLMLFVGVK